MGVQSELLESLKEMRAACCAAMRVIADLDVKHLAGADADTREQRFVDELQYAGVKDGFGVRADAAIKKAEREAQLTFAALADGEGTP